VGTTQLVRGNVMKKTSTSHISAKSENLCFVPGRTPSQLGVFLVSAHQDQDLDLSTLVIGEMTGSARASCFLDGHREKSA
jgi:hypothetical protein